MAKNLEKENKELTDRIARLEQLLMGKAVEEQKTEDQEENEDVLFISLCPNLVNLCTEPHGKGDIYTFEKSGEEVLIPKDDAKKIIKVNKTMITQGLVYIDNEKFIKDNRLTSVYKNILNIKELRDLFKKKSDDVLEVLRNMQPLQRDVFKRMLIAKVCSGENIDKNIIYAANDFFKEEEKSKEDILSQIEYSKYLSENKDNKS